MKVTKFTPATAGVGGGGGSSGPAGGDLGGGFPSPSVDGILGKPIDGTPADGDVISFDSGTGHWVLAAPAATAPTGPAGGDLGATYPNPSVLKIHGVAVPSGPAAGDLLVATGPTAAVWSAPTASMLTTRWEPLTNGDPVSPELIFDGLGDVIMVEVAT